MCCKIKMFANSTNFMGIFKRLDTRTVLMRFKNKQVHFINAKLLHIMRVLPSVSLEISSVTNLRIFIIYCNNKILTYVVDQFKNFYNLL